MTFGANKKNGMETRKKMVDGAITNPHASFVHSNFYDKIYGGGEPHFGLWWKMCHVAFTLQSTWNPMEKHTAYTAPEKERARAQEQGGRSAV